MSNLKSLTARSMKWNIIDRVSSQLLYAVTGIVLANMVSEEEFGLIGAILVFQAFASLFIDSGFSYALIQRKAPTRLDYSTILWFNLGIAVVAYGVLFAGAPLIARWNHDMRIVPLARVMFLAFILNASAIVQTNRLMKKMDVRMVAVSNAIGLFGGSVVGIWLAVAGYGAWAIVWQTLTLNFLKSLVLWLTSHWLPLLKFSFASLRSFFKVGSGMMTSSFLNVVFQNVNAMVIGMGPGMRSLGYYTQADKWSKMGITSITQVLTASFLPTLSEVQDQPERFTRITTKMNRFTAYLLFPAMLLLAAMATAIFHALFGTKWDPSIVLFQLLLVRGIFTGLASLYNNYLIAVARTRLVVAMEVVRDVASLGLLFAALPFLWLEKPGNPVWGLEILLLGQLAASALTFFVMAWRTAPVVRRQLWAFIGDNLPYLVLSLVSAAAMWVFSLWIADPWQLLLVQGAVGIGVYMGLNQLFYSAIQREVLAHILGRNKEEESDPTCHS